MGQSVPQVSVLMTVYNGERYLAEAIDSILAQTFSDFEFIIVDDGSQDSSAKIIRDYAKRDERIYFLQLERNRGQAVALNRGLAKARGEFITRMDCDDISLPERLRKQVDYLQACPEIGVLGAWQENVDQDLRPLVLYELPERHAEIVFNHLISRPSIGGAVVMMRAEALVGIGGFDPQRQTARDWELFAKLSARTRLANLQECLYLYRRHERNMTKVRKQELLSDWEDYRKRWLNRLLGEREQAPAPQERFLRMRHSERFGLLEGLLLRRDVRRLVNGLIASETCVEADRAILRDFSAPFLESAAPRLWVKFKYWRRYRLGF